MLSAIQKLFSHQVIGTVFFVAVLLVLKTEVPANAADENQVEATGQVENIQTDENSQVYIPMPGKHRVSLPILRGIDPIMAQDKADEQTDQQADQQADDGAGNVADEQTNEQADQQVDDGASNVAQE